MTGWATDTAIAVSVLIICVLAIRRPFARAFGARAAYALWLAPAARALTPPLPAESLPFAPPTVGGSANFALMTTSAPQGAPLSAESVLAAVWLGGAVLFLALHLWRHHRFIRDALKTGRPLHVPGVRYDVVASERVDGPMATGLVHPLILVPSDFERRMDSDEQRFALWHEQLHHRRGDLWASAGALLLVALLWFNPFAHLALGAFRRDMEAACDASLLAEAGEEAAPAYAATILRCASRPVPRSLCALTAIDELKGRLTMMKLNHGPVLRAMGLGLAAVIAIGGIATAGAAQEKAKEETKKFEKRIVVRHVGEEKDVVKRGDKGEFERMALDCPGEKFEFNSAGGTDQKKEDVKFVLCTRAGEPMFDALKKAEADLQKEDDMPADRKAELLAKIRAKLDELRVRG